MATIVGGDGDDNLSGGTENDSVSGGNGNDTISGGAGDDTILGQAGNDVLSGGRGDDSLKGGAGNDTFRASGGDDTYIGGEGEDCFDILNSTDGGVNEFGFRINVSTSGTGTGQDQFGVTGQTFEGIDKFVGGFSSDDRITITDAVDRDEVQGLDTAIGTATFPDGSTQNFGGPGQQTLQELLDNSTGPFSVQVTSGDDDGNIGGLEFDSFETINFSVTCFVRGTQILTQQGDMSVEDLSVGDMIKTVDHGIKPIRWIGRRRFSPFELAVRPQLLPILIRAGALGHNRPSGDLCVSPQHRMLLASKIAERMFGEPEVLIAAKKLLSLEGVEQVTPSEDLWYYHILFDEHELVYANGAPSESLHLGVEALKTMSPQAFAEIAEIFPEVIRPDFVPSAARHIPQKGRKINNFVSRLNRKISFETASMN